ncbi:hypothetical protein [Paenibacillus prosopidis]|uniref:Uncharacterized protein n=1 Tax=Paenibacillus prosopidis TaxID=630520 RepID=A0A368VQ77_9BACL|nr:hypothetical protein [Paenibacillus prosopidis]RCW43012.1 hypothetical protein DFP97_11475 [Paenibacillus prosopidis]
MENLIRLERLLENLERHQAKRHVRNAFKEWLLASRTVIDSVIDTMEKEKDTPVARKINISKE